MTLRCQRSCRLIAFFEFSLVICWFCHCLKISSSLCGASGARPLRVYLMIFRRLLGVLAASLFNDIASYCGPGASCARFSYSDTLPRTLQNTYHIRINSVLWRPWRLPRDSPILTPSREPSVRHPMNGCPKHGQTKTHTIVSHSDVHQA